MSLKHRPRRDREGPRMAMADPGSPKRPKPDPMPRAKPLVDDGKPTGRKAMAEKLVGEVASLIYDENPVHAAFLTYYPTILEMIYRQYGQEMLQVLEEKLESIPVRNKFESVYNYALVIVNMACVIGPDDLRVVVPPLMKKLKGLVATHKPGDSDKELEAVVLALNVTHDEGAVAELNRLAKDEVLARDIEHLRNRNRRKY